MKNAPAQLIARTLAVRTAAHLAHLQTSSYAQHVALGDFYSSIIDTMDEYAEVYMGLFGMDDVQDVPEVAIPAQRPLVFLTTFHEWLSENYEACSRGETCLKNLLDEMKATTARTMYKLRFLK